MRRRPTPAPGLADGERPPCGFQWKVDDDGTLFSGGCACGRPRYEHPGFGDLWARMRAEDAGVDVMRNQLDRAMSEGIHVRQRMPLRTGMLPELRQNGHRRYLLDGETNGDDETGDGPE